MSLPSKKQVRRRGVILTDRGSRKLHQAKSEAEFEHNFERYTLETLGEEIGITPTTLSKVFSGSSAVDKQTLKCCFDAFNLTLLKEDYVYLKSQENLAKIGSMFPAETFSHLQPDCDFRSNIPQMSQSQDDSQTPHPTAPEGQMPLDSVLYIDRPILESLCYEAIGQPGAMVNIRAPKQMGKTSLLTRILAYAATKGFYSVFLSLQLADGEILQKLERFLEWFCARVSRQLGIPNQTADFWDNFFGSKSNATDYFEDVILANCDHPLVIAIDEINQLFAYPEIAREFLELLRTWTEKAKLRVAGDNNWHNLRLVTVYSTEILIPSSIALSLLNTALVIKLPEFTSPQVQDLAERWEEKITEQEIEQLITLLGGHPYRLQLAFSYLQQQTITLEELLANSKSTLAIYAEHLQQKWWNLQCYPELLPIFTQIVSNPNPIEIQISTGFQLEKMGLIHLEGNQASLSCELFRPFFQRILN